jgi:hypothetical protein
MVTTNNSGKKLELAVQEALRVHQGQFKSHFFRLYDATSSGGRGHTQAGDFVWLTCTEALLIECKSTETGKDLFQLVSSSKKNREQLPRHKVWNLSGHKSLYIYGNLLSQQTAIYWGMDVITCIQNKQTLTPVVFGEFRDLPKQIGCVYTYLKEIHGKKTT